MSLEQSIDRLAAAVERLSQLQVPGPAEPGILAAAIEQAHSGPAAEPARPRRGRPPKAAAEPVALVTELAKAAPEVHVPTTRTPLTQAQTTDLIAAFTALGKSKGTSEAGSEAIRRVLAEMGVNTVVAISGEQCAAAIARAKALTP